MRKESAERSCKLKVKVRISLGDLVGVAVRVGGIRVGVWLVLGFRVGVGIRVGLGVGNKIGLGLG